MSLTEVMIGGAVLAGVALAGAKLMSQQRTAQKLVQSDHELTNYHQSLIKELSRPATCHATFKGSYGGPINSGEISLFRCDELSDPDCKDPKKDAGAVTPVSTPFATTGTWIDGKKTASISKIEVVNTVSSTGPVLLRITYDYNPNLPGARKISKDLSINVRFTNGGGFKECVNDQETSVNNLQNDICKSMNYSQINSNGQIAEWDEAEQKCVMKTSIKTCDPGWVVEGIRSDGTVHCIKATQHFGGSDVLDGTSSTNCNGSTRMVFINGNVEVVCY